MIEFQFRSIERWPGEPTRSRRRSQFRAGYSQTLKQLERELEHLRARQVVIQADCSENEIRRDGQLRSDARLRGPGIIVSFDCPKGSLSFPCDMFTDWQDNLRAIALGLEALRAVDRYGVTKRAEQYKGWAKLAAPPDANGFASARDAAVFVAGYVPGFDHHALLRDVGAFREGYRAAAAMLHPDRCGGNDAGFKRLQIAREMLERHHGI